MLIKEEGNTDEMFITRARQHEELILAKENLMKADCAIKDSLADEIIAMELRLAGLCFDRLLGTTLGEDVLDAIFSQFCIGK